MYHWKGEGLSYTPYRKQLKEAENHVLKYNAYTPYRKQLKEAENHVLKYNAYTPYRKQLHLAIVVTIYMYVFRSQDTGWSHQ